MATMLSPTTQPILLEGVSWMTYTCLLADFGDSHAARLAYDQGRLEVRVPSFTHERLNRTLAALVEILAGARGYDLERAGSTTFKREDIGRGFEPDSCFYLQHAAQVRGKDRLDLSMDPPPDLVIEIDITHPSLDKLPIYEAIEVPEVWRYDGHHLRIYQLVAGRYDAVQTSGVFPGITRDRLAAWMETSQALPYPTWLAQILSFAQAQGRGGQA